MFFQFQDRPEFVKLPIYLSEYLISESLRKGMKDLD